MTDPEFRQLAIRGLTSAIDRAFEEHGLSEHDDKRIAGLCNSFGLTANEMWGSFAKPPEDHISLFDDVFSN